VKRPKIEEYNKLLLLRAQAAKAQEFLKKQHATGYEFMMCTQWHIEPCVKHPRTNHSEQFGAAFRDELDELIKERQHELVAEVMARLDARIARAAEAARPEVRALLTEVETAGKPSNFEITDLGSVLAKLFELQASPKPTGGAQ
jgi:hypothetical protein